MKKIILAAAMILLILLVLICRNEQDPKFFRNYVDEVIKAGVEKDYEKFMEFFSTHYRDDYGVNYIYLKNIIKNQFGKYDRFEASYEDLSVSEFYTDDSDNTLVDLNLGVSVQGFRNGIKVDLIGESGGKDNITVTLRRSFLDEWDIVKLENLDSEETVY